MITIASYTLMQVIFFGVPHFTLDSVAGVISIGYALSALWLVGIGAWRIRSGI